MAEKSISVQAGYYSLTVINGDNVVLDNKSVMKTGSSTLDKFTIDTDFQTTIRIRLPKYYGVSALPFLRYYPSYNPMFLLNEEYFELVDASTYELTTSFDAVHNDNISYDEIKISLRCNASEMYAYVYTNLTNCTCNVQSGNALPVDTTFTVTCDSNREFQITPQLDYTYGAEVISEYLDKVNDCTYSKSIKLVKGREYCITGEAVKKSAMIDKYPLTTAYRVTKDELRDIVKRRFVRPEYEPVEVSGVVVMYNVKEEYIDTAKYVTALFRVNIPLQAGEKQRVFFGPYDMEIDCDVLDDDTITLDFGSVEIRGIYGNAIDYEHTDISLYLPYVGFTALNASDFMNKTVSLTYQVNLMNGEALAVISADNQPIQTVTCNVAVKIPYQLSGGEYVHTDIEPNANYLHEVNPFMYVRTHIATQPDGMPYHDTNIYAVLGTLTGYTEATEIAFAVQSDRITTTEIEEIKSLIAGGVIL